MMMMMNTYDAFNHENKDVSQSEKERANVQQLNKINAIH